MSILKKINIVRGQIMRSLTKMVGTEKSNGAEGFSMTEIKHVLICRPNHRLGNLLLITPLLQDVLRTLPHAKIDLLVKGSIAPILFKHYKVNRIIQLPRWPFKDLITYIKGWLAIKAVRYDLVINAIGNSSSGRLSTKFSNGKLKIFGDVDEQIKSLHPDYEHMGKYPVYSFRRLLEKIGYGGYNDQMTLLHLKLSQDELAEGKRIIDRLVPVNAKTICIFTYATDEKIYPQEWWTKLYHGLKTQHPDYNVLEILPAENVSMIQFIAPSFYSLDIRMVGAVIANTALFIGSDSGMMHLSSAVQTPTIGLFKTTNPCIYAPYNRGSVAIDTNKSSIEDCLNEVTKQLAKSSQQRAVNEQLVNEH